LEDAAESPLGGTIAPRSDSAAPGIPDRTAAAPTNRATQSASVLPGFPPPEADLPAGKLEDRVDGAADKLREDGCRRLIVWKLLNPPADLEILVFDKSEGAKQTLAREAGPGRDPGPGDEASVSDQAILFRRGTVIARLMADPEAPPAPAALMETARAIDRAISASPSTLLAGAGAGAGGGSTL